MHHIEIILGKRSNFDHKSKFLWHWTSKNWGFKLKKAERGSRDKKIPKIGALTVDQAVDRFVGAENLKKPPRVIYFTVFLFSLKTLHLPTSKDYFGLILGPIEGFEVDFGTHLRLGFQFET